MRGKNDTGRETPQSAANTVLTEGGREYETEDTSSGKVRPQGVKQKGMPVVVGTVNTNGGKLSNEKYDELACQVRGLVRSLGGYFPDSDPIKMPELFRCLMSLPGPVMVKLFMESQIVAGIAFRCFGDEVNEKIIQVMIEAVKEKAMSLDQLKQIVFRFNGHKKNSYFAQCLYESRYTHSGSLHPRIFIALIELLKTAANTRNDAEHICRWISDVPVNKANTGCFSQIKEADLGRQLNASRKDFKKKQDMVDVLPRYQVDARIVLEAYDGLLKHLSKKAGDEATQTLRQHVDKALFSYPQSIEDRSGVVFDLKATPSLENMDAQTVLLDDLAAAAIAEAKAKLNEMAERRRNYWKGTEKEEPTPEQKIEALTLEVGQLKQQAGEQSEKIATLEQEISRLLKRHPGRAHSEPALATEIQSSSS